MSQLEEGEAAEDFDDFGFYFPPITDAELKSRRIWNVSLRPEKSWFQELAAVMAEGCMSPAEYLDCVRAAADEAN
jgi:hypothetical protein